MYAGLFALALYKTQANKLTDLDLTHFQILSEPRMYQEALIALSNLTRDLHPQPLPMAQELCVSSAPRTLGPVWVGCVCVSSLGSWVDLGPALLVVHLWSSLCPLLLLYLTGLPGWTLDLVTGLPAVPIISIHHCGWGHTWFLGHLPLGIHWHLLLPEKY